MNITRAAIEKNRITIVALLLIVVSGVMAYRAMPHSSACGFEVFGMTRRLRRRLASRDNLNHG